MKWIWLVVLLLLVGCTESGVHKKYDMKATASGDGSMVVVYTELEAVTETDTESGDAGISPQTSASLYGPSQVDGMMKDLQYVYEMWKDNRQSEVNNPPAPAPTPTPEPEPEVEETVIEGIDTVLYTYPCEDRGFTYRDNSEQVGIPQQVCLFTDFDTCMDIPVDKFTMIWRDPTGNERMLDVPNQCSISMASKEDGYGKFRPAHDKEPYKPVAYAPRGFNASEVDIIGKKQGASSSSDLEGWRHSVKVEWEGNPNPDVANRVFSRCWWTETSGGADYLQRKFNFDWDGWKNGDDVLVVFSDGLEVKVTDTQKRHYPPGSPGNVKWGVPKMNDHPCKHYPSIAAPKDAIPEYAILYYN